MATKHDRAPAQGRIIEAQACPATRARLRFRTAPIASLLVAGASACFGAGPPAAGAELSFFSASQLRSMAEDYIAVVAAPSKASVNQIVSSSRFAGYAAARVENLANSAASADDKVEHDLAEECLMTKPLKVVAQRAAIVIAGAPLNRAESPQLTMGLAVLWACDDTRWKPVKPK
jgi:hypothetical protein